MAAENIGDLVPTKIPGYADAADIQAALRLYHYGSYTYDPNETNPANLINPSMAYYINDLQYQIDGITGLSENIFAAKGNILTATAPATAAVLSVGTNNQFLIANSATATGLQWTNTLVAPTITSPTLTGNVTTRASATQDAVIIAGRAGGTSSYGVTITPTTLTASRTLTLPNVTGTVVTTGDTATVTNTMLTNSSVTIGSTAVSLGSSAATVAGLTLTSPTLNSAFVAQPFEKYYANTTAFNSAGQAVYTETNGSVHFFSTASVSSGTLNITASATTSLNTIMTTSQAITVAVLINNTTVGAYPSTIQIDGTNVTPKWLGGVIPTTGNTNSIDAYTFTIIKTGSAAFTVLASQSKFA